MENEGTDLESQFCARGVKPHTIAKMGIVRFLKITLSACHEALNHHPFDHHASWPMTDIKWPYADVLVIVGPYGTVTRNALDDGN
ncbi:hypothetical protein D3C76_1482120 [compost metagenome]